MREPTILYNHWWPRLLRQGAVTWAGTIYVAGPAILPPLLVHETVHLEQQARLGLVRFAAQYAREYAAGRLRGLSHRDAYLCISFEAEARTISGVA